MLSKLATTFLLIPFFLVSTATANIFKADQLFSEEKYQQALSEYAKSANIGSPHAFYQLGTLSLRGLGTELDSINAYVWFSLAAEYGFSDSTMIAKEIFGLLSDADKQSAQTLLSQMEKQLGKWAVHDKYFPVIKQEYLAERVTFGGKGRLDVNYTDPDLILSESELTPDGFSTGNEDSLFLSDGQTFSGLSSVEPGRLNALLQPRAHSIERRTPFLIVEYDVGPDGSIRNMRQVQEIGYARTLKERFVFSTFAAPTFNQKRVNFVNRTYIGAATYGLFQMKDANERLFFKLRRHARKLRASDELEDKYQYAMMLLTFKWLKREEGEVDRRLKEVAQSGHPRAQYEYGAKLYREQTDPMQAIHWISEASKYDFYKAEYFLGNILLHSPWVEKDEKKALFWFESAMQKDDQNAGLKAAKLKLLATDKSLHDIPSATQYLEKLKETQTNNPEYYFLLAVAHKDKDNRDFKLAVRYIKRAIRLGEKFNWDVSYWQGLLTKWTTGAVYIID